MCGKVQSKKSRIVFKAKKKGCVFFSDKNRYIRSVQWNSGQNIARPISIINYFAYKYIFVRLMVFPEEEPQYPSS